MLRVEGVSKAFGASRALDGVSFNLERGEVHALIGENGAGKSTLMKILSGALRPDGGSITLEGKPYAPRSPREGHARGVAMIYQELALAPHLSVEANVMLGQERTALGMVRRGEHRKLAREAFRLLDHAEIVVATPVGALGMGVRQLVEVARALVSRAKVVIFDEPTSSLAEEDAARLFEVIRRLQGEGISIIYISHFLEEVRAIAGRYTALRDGRTVESGAIAGVSTQGLIRAMVGRELVEVFPKIPHEAGEVVLNLKAVRGESKAPIRADLQVRRGEILGIAGLIGSGRTEVLRAIFGLDPVTGGQVVVKGVESAGGTPRARWAQGVGLVSEDRKGEGLALERSIEDNLTYPSLGRYGRWGWLDLRGRRRASAKVLEEVRVKAQGAGQAVGELSGGNQQKVAIGRLLQQGSDVILLDEPTRGIDVGSKAEIYRMIGEAAARGAAVVMVSSYLPELFGVCDRLAVMARGTLSEARAIGEWSPEQVMDAATAS